MKLDTSIGVINLLYLTPYLLQLKDLDKDLFYRHRPPTFSNLKVITIEQG